MSHQIAAYLQSKQAVSLLAKMLDEVLHKDTGLKNGEVLQEDASEQRAVGLLGFVEIHRDDPWYRVDVIVDGITRQLLVQFREPKGCPWLVTDLGRSVLALRERTGLDSDEAREQLRGVVGENPAGPVAFFFENDIQAIGERHELPAMICAALLASLKVASLKTTREG